MNKPNLPNWTKHIHNLPMSHPALKPGAVTMVEVVHDYHCALFKGRQCNCKPDIKMKTKSAIPNPQSSD